MTKIIRFLNFIYIILAAASITLFCTLPVAKVGVDAVIDNDQITELLKTIPGAENLTTHEIFGDEKISTSVNLDISTQILFHSFKSDAEQVVEDNFITPNIKNIVTSLKNPINKVAVAVLKNTAKQTLKQQIENAGGSVSEDELNKATEAVYEEITKEGATVDSVAEVIKEQIDDLVTGSDVPLDDIKQQLQEELEKYGAIKEDGTIENIDILTSAFLYDLLSDPNNPLNGGGSGEEEESSEAKYVVANAPDPNDKTVEEKAAEVQDLLAKQIRQRLPEGFSSVIVSIGKGMLFGLIIFIGTWGFVLLFTLLRTFRKKKCYTWVGTWFWPIGLIQVVCGVGMTIVSKFAFKLVQKVGGSITGSAATIFDNMDFTITSSAFIPSIFFLCMIPLAIIYHIFKKKLKKQIKIDKAVDKKIAAMGIEE